MLGIVVSRADSASVHIGDHLRALADWERHEDNTRPDADGGGTVYRAPGVALREFETRHLDLVRPADAFEDPTLVAVASRHAGETGPLLTAHHTGNFGPAEHGGADNALARACPNAHAHVLDALTDHAPAGYEVGTECTHHGPSDVGAPSLFVEVGSGPEQWTDPDAARAVARAILDLRGVAPDRPVEASPGASEPAPDESPDTRRRQLVGFGGGHYAPRFERVVRETDWAVGHIAADWGLDAVSDHREAVFEAAFEQSRAAYALVDGDRPEIADTVDSLGYRAVSETWVRETDGVDLGFVRATERAVCPVDEGLRFGEGTERTDDWTVATLPAALLDEAFGIDRAATRTAVSAVALAFDTAEGGTRPTGAVVLADPEDRMAICEALLDVLGERYDSVEREGETVIARETAFDPERARTLGVPEGPKFGRLADGQPVDVDGETIPPETVQIEREQRFSLSS